MKRRILLAAAAGAMAATIAMPALAQTKYKDEYKLSTVVGPAFPWGKGAEIWIDLVKQRTNGRINIKLYPGVSLVQGDQTREFTAIRQGIIDLAIGSTINWSPPRWPPRRWRRRSTRTSTRCRPSSAPLSRGARARRSGSTLSSSAPMAAST